MRKAERIREEQRNEARENLLKILKPGMRVYTVLRHVSRSGMMRHISVMVPVMDYTFDRYEGEPEIRCIDYWASRLLGWSMADRGIKVGRMRNGYGFPSCLPAWLCPLAGWHTGVSWYAEW